MVRGGSAPWERESQTSHEGKVLFFGRQFFHLLSDSQRCLEQLALLKLERARLNAWLHFILRASRAAYAAAQAGEGAQAGRTRAQCDSGQHEKLRLPQIAILVGAGVAACSDYRSGPKLQPRVKNGKRPGLSESEDSEDEFLERRRRRLLEDADADADKRRREDIALPLYLLGAFGARRQWVSRPRSLDWYTSVLKARDGDGELLCGDSHYIMHFRMGRATFDWLKAQLRPHIKTQRLSAGQRLAMALRYMASGSTMRVVADDMGRGHATVHRAVHDVCLAIISQLGAMISMPSTVDQLKSSAAKFMLAGRGVPQCCFAVDGTHVALRDFGLQSLFNRLHYCSLNVQAVCDGAGLWVAVQVGNAGSMHDARAFSESDVGMALQGALGQLLWDARVVIQGTVVPMSILADSAYACHTFVLPAFKDTIAARAMDKTRFNTQHSQARRTVECSFGRLKARWRVLLRENDLTLPYVSTVIMACFVLHNIVEVRAEPAPDENDPEYLALKEAYDAMFAGLVDEEVEGADDEGVVWGGAERDMPGSRHPPPLNVWRQHGNAVRDAVVGYLGL
ncbi:hypothetical protein QJQ45_009695 [Haematococcus lacustris]|nr:hypothetical protein QJQ45_009695 [Haematococcus lacustris]